MTKRHLVVLGLLIMGADGVAAFLTFSAVSALRFHIGGPDAEWSVGIPATTAAIVFAVTWVGTLWALGLYRLRVRLSLVAEARDLTRATIAVLVISLSALFLLHQDNVSRVFLAALFVCQPVVSLIGRAALHHWFEYLRRRGYNTSYMLVIGAGHLAQTFADSVESHDGLGLKVIGHLTVPLLADAGAPGGREVPSVTRDVLGPVEDLNKIFATMTVDEVAIALPKGAQPLLDPIVSLAADVGKTVRIPTDIDESTVTSAMTEEFDGFLVRSLVHDGQRDVELAAKRMLDFVGSLIGILVLSPMLAAIAVAIRVRDGSPILFRQVRVGRHGRPFTIYKFRTMVPGADDQYAALAELSDTQGAAFKMHDDPRVTPLGAFLRRFSLDELPQLFNVLKGEMSLVGPRPAPPREVAAYDMWHRRRLAMRPGMTGLWQVESRIDEHFDDRAQLDMRYIDHWSLRLDLGILLRTLPALLLVRGR